MGNLQKAAGHAIPRRAGRAGGSSIRTIVIRVSRSRENITPWHASNATKCPKGRNLPKHALKESGKRASNVILIPTPASSSGIAKRAIPSKAGREDGWLTHTAPRRRTRCVASMLRSIVSNVTRRPSRGLYWQRPALPDFLETVLPVTKIHTTGKCARHVRRATQSRDGPDNLCSLPTTDTLSSN